MKIFIHLVILTTCCVLFFSSVEAQSGNIFAPTLRKAGLTLENFEQYAVGSIPNKWYNLRGSKRPASYSEQQKNAYKYEIEEENGNRYLRYNGQEAKHLNLPLTNEAGDNIYDINIYETPILSWKVRPHNWPQNANEDDDERNDSVASIYVVFDMGHVLFRKVPKSIRYTWSTTLPKGEELSKFFGNQKVVVIESGKKDKGQWVTFKRNIVNDYRRLFGDDPPEQPLAILILSDGDSTDSFVKADYDDIKLLPKH